ncbi:hypothetical protein B0H13DRAFT_1132685 [Mycena leptocephala]|nr:hypothetical protein B0H13DRAFT_1132685 [Mycena leptocephala]
MHMSMKREAKMEKAGGCGRRWRRKSARGWGCGWMKADRARRWASTSRTWGWKYEGDNVHRDEDGTRAGDAAPRICMSMGVEMEARERRWCGVGYPVVLALALIEAGAEDVVRMRARGRRWGWRWRRGWSWSRCADRKGHDDLDAHTVSMKEGILPSPSYPHPRPSPTSPAHYDTADTVSLPSLPPSVPVSLPTYPFLAVTHDAATFDSL